MDKTIAQQKLVGAAVVTMQPHLKAFAYQQLTVTGGTAQSLTVPSGALYCEIRVESATTTGIIMYYLMLGSTTLPTASTGMPLTYLDLFDINTGDDIVNFRVIAVSGVHQLNVQYYK